jgi:hypothetical protein
MNSLLEMPVTDSFSQALETLSAVAGVLSDPKVAGKVLGDLAAASKQARATIEQANAASKAADEKLAEHAEQIQRELAEHVEFMDGERQKFGAEKAAFEKWQVGMRKQAEDLVAAAKGEHDQAAALRRDLDSRLERLKSVAA